MSRRKPKPYPSDLTDAQWELIAPMVAPRPGGRPAAHCRRRIVDAISYVARTGCAWRQLPHDFAPWQTVYWYFQNWNDDGVVDRIHDGLRANVRDRVGRDPLASAGVVDSQSVKGADTVGRDSRGYDAGKKVNGRKRHVVVDTMGLLIAVMVSTAGLQDRDGGRGVLQRAKIAMPSIALVWADGGYAGQLIAWVAQRLRITLDIVRKPEGQRGFEVIPRRWVVERTLAWLVRCRRLVHDYERLPQHSEAMVKWVMIGLMVRRLEPPPGRRPWQSSNQAA